MKEKNRKALVIAAMLLIAIVAMIVLLAGCSSGSKPAPETEVTAETLATASGETTEEVPAAAEVFTEVPTEAPTEVPTPEPTQEPPAPTGEVEWIGGDFTVDDYGNYAFYIDNPGDVVFSTESRIFVTGFVYSAAKQEEGDTDLHLARVSWQLNGRGGDAELHFTGKSRQDAEHAKHDLEAVGTWITGEDQGPFWFEIEKGELAPGTYDLKVTFLFGQGTVASAGTTLTVSEDGIVAEDGDAWLAEMGYR